MGNYPKRSTKLEPSRFEVVTAAQTTKKYTLHYILETLEEIRGELEAIRASLRPKKS